MKETTLALLLVLAAVLILLVTPLAFIWSVNSLFGSGIPYTPNSFLAAWTLLLVIQVVLRSSNEKSP